MQKLFIIAAMLIVSVCQAQHIQVRSQNNLYTLSETIKGGQYSVVATSNGQIVNVTKGKTRWPEMFYDLFTNINQSMCPADCEYQLDAEIELKNPGYLPDYLFWAGNVPVNVSGTIQEIIRQYPSAKCIVVTGFRN